MPKIVLLSAFVSPPAAKKQPAAMNPTQTSAKPAKGPSARKAQIPPSNATLTAKASNSDMVCPHWSLKERAAHLEVVCFRESRPRNFNPICQFNHFFFD